MRFTHTLLSIFHTAPPKYLPVFISIDGEERLCQFLTVPHLSRRILLSTSFIFWNPLFQIVMQLLLLSKILWQAPLPPIKWTQKAPRYCGKPHYPLSNEHRKQQRVFGGGGMSSRKSVARTDCSWQAETVQVFTEVIQHIL